MLTRRQFNKLLLGSLLLPSLSCSNLKKKKFIPGTLRLNLGFEPDTLDWAKATDSYSFDVITNIMAGLTKYNNKLQSIPSLAKNWTVSNGGKTYIFYLNKDAKWSDGRPLTSTDFVYGWQRILNPHTAAPYAYLLYPIKNAFLFNSGKLEDPNKLGVKAVNDNILQVELESPLAFFLNLTSWAVYFPQRKDIIEKYRDDWTEPKNIISCGPFNLEKWQHEYKLSLIKNKYYRNPEPQLEKIKYYIVPEQSSAFSLYLNDELDCIDSRSIPISEIETVKKMKETETYPLLRGTYVGFNVNKAPFDNKLVRAAFSYALDRKIFPKVLNRNEIPASTWIPPGLEKFYSPDIGCNYNPVLAKELLAEAGYPNGTNFPRVTMLFPTREDAKLIAEAAQASWQKVLNVKIEIANQEWKVYLATLQQNPPHLFRMSWGADYPDPDTFMTLFTSTSGNNHGRWKSETYDQIVDKAAATLDLGERQSLYRHAQKILLEEEIAIAPLFFNTQILLNKPWVKNFEFNSMDLVFCEKISVAL
ncbi:MAG: peptide ABC transporter substrate-binding protein [Candidatus Melainabacteria bacterium]|nr:peptide ABC transporter substrate-binding protein [Candidatus Melainabacteria bacterium]